MVTCRGPANIQLYEESKVKILWTEIYLSLEEEEEDNCLLLWHMQWHVYNTITRKQIMHPAQLVTNIAWSWNHSL